MSERIVIECDETTCKSIKGPSNGWFKLWVYENSFANFEFPNKSLTDNPPARKDFCSTHCLTKFITKFLDGCKRTIDYYDVEEDREESWKI